MKNSIMFLILLFILGCKNSDNMVAPTPLPCYFGLCDTSKLEVVWQKSFCTDTSQCNSFAPQLSNNLTLYSTDGCKAILDTLRFFDSKNGTAVSKWFDYLPDNTVTARSDSKRYKNYHFFTTGNFIYGIDLLTGNTKFRSSTNGTGGPRLNVQEDFVYHTRSLSFGVHDIESYLVKSSIDEVKWDTVFIQKKIGDFEPTFIEMPCIWTNPDGDKIAIFQIRFVDRTRTNTTIPDERTDLVAYNMNQKKEYFRFNDIDSFKGGSVQLPNIIGNRAYVAFSKSIYCFDLINKTILWQKQFVSDETFSSGNPFLMVNGKLYVKPDNRSLYALNPDTGSQISVDLDTGSGASDMVYYKGLIYFTSFGTDKIYAIEEATGKKIWAEPSPNTYKATYNNFRSFSNSGLGGSGLAIDTINDYLFTSDYYFMMCLKLPKR
jgi:hypothetical protein